MRNPQLNRHGELTHLITTEGLPRAKKARAPSGRRSLIGL